MLPVSSRSTGPRHRFSMIQSATNSLAGGPMGDMVGCLLPQKRKDWSDMRKLGFWEDTYIYIYISVSLFYVFIFIYIHIFVLYAFVCICVFVHNLCAWLCWKNMRTYACAVHIHFLICTGIRDDWIFQLSIATCRCGSKPFSCFKKEGRPSQERLECTNNPHTSAIWPGDRRGRWVWIIPRTAHAKLLVWLSCPFGCFGIVHTFTWQHCILLYLHVHLCVQKQVHTRTNTHIHIHKRVYLLI